MSQDREQLRERFHALHYCTTCNTQPGLDPTWRWNGKAWEHRCQGVHPQVGHWEMEPLDAVALLKERDELRAQVAVLRGVLQDAFDTPWVGIDPDHVNEITRVKRGIQATLRQTSADAAQYVRGLEAALQPFAEQWAAQDEQAWLQDDQSVAVPLEYYRRARQALAAKEDRG